MTEETKPEMLNSDDLLAFQSLLDIATRRGAFQANELSAIGKLYDKLKAFNDFIAKQVKEQTKETEAT